MGLLPNPVDGNRMSAKRTVCFFLVVIFSCADGFAGLARFFREVAVPLCYNKPVRRSCY
jgi:hypothetical protein